MWWKTCFPECGFGWWLHQLSPILHRLNVRHTAIIGNGRKKNKHTSKFTATLRSGLRWWMYFHYQNQTEQQWAKTITKHPNVCRGGKNGVDIIIENSLRLHARAKWAGELWICFVSLHTFCFYWRDLLIRKDREEKERAAFLFEIFALETPGKQNNLYLLPLVIGKCLKVLDMRPTGKQQWVLGKPKDQVLMKSPQVFFLFHVYLSQLTLLHKDWSHKAS